MHWHTIFDVSQTNALSSIPSGTWWVAAIFPVMWAIAIAAKKWYQVPRKNFIYNYLAEEDPFQKRIEIVSRCMPIMLVLLCLLLSALVGVSSFWWEKLNNAYKRGDCEQIEGVVGNLGNQLSASKVQTKSFTVNGRQFTLEEYCLVPGFTLRCPGVDLIKEGSKVRLWFKDSSIARVDVWG